MPSREVLIRQLVDQWLIKAQADLDAAMALVDHEGGLWSIVAFHCQQSAEKFIKAELTALQIEFGKTHDISVLLDRLNEGKNKLADDLSSAEALTVFGVQARYPGDGPDVDQAEAKHALDLAKTVARLIRDELGE